MPRRSPRIHTRGRHTHLVLVSIPPWSLGVEINAPEDYRQVFDKVLAIAKCAEKAEKVKVFVILGVHPAMFDNMENKKIEVEVNKAYPNEAGRGIARVAPVVLKALELIPGDIIAIEGSWKATAAKVWRARPEDEQDTNVMHIDGFARTNAGVGIGDHVQIRKVEVKIADKIFLMAPEGVYTMEESSSETIKPSIMKRPIVKGDIVPVWKTIQHPQFGNLAKEPVFSMIVIKTNPVGIVLIKENTEVINLDLL